MKWFVLIILCLVVLLPLLTGSSIKIIPLYIGSQKFTVEVADNAEKWAMGLMFREVVSDDFGMLFVSDFEDYRSFWMKNCKVHLDIIFLNSNKQIINIHYNVPPCQYDPCPSYESTRPAQYILELRGNRAKELNLKPGDVIQFSWK
jgi:uncharacterized membrane protein (UPF0127 family)